MDKVVAFGGKGRGFGSCYRQLTSPLDSPLDAGVPFLKNDARDCFISKGNTEMREGANDFPVVIHRYGNRCFMKLTQVDFLAVP